MRLLSCLFAAFAAVASAQTPADADNGRELAATRLNTDLANLKDLPADPGVSGLVPCINRRDRTAPGPEECRPVDRVMADLALVRASGPLRAPTKALSYNLVIALSGRELEPDALSRLLFALGVGEDGAENCLRSFVRNAEQMSTPPDFEPIPPAPIFR